MESFLNRYRSLTVLLLVIFAQLVLLAVQVKNDQDVRIIRVWTVSAVTPVARIVEWLRGGSIGFVRDYILLRDTHEENRRMQANLDRLKMENLFLRNELNTADRAKALAVFQEHTPSRSIAATVIGTGAGTNSKVVFVDRGSTSGIERGMAVVTPDGIVGKVIAAYPTASEILLVTDPDFAAGVISQKNQVRGTLKGLGTPMCKVDYVPFEEKVEPGDWFYTSGDDRIFPRGFPVGVVKAVRPAQPFKEILLEPSGVQRGLEDVLILLEAVHQVVPDVQATNSPLYIAPPPPAGETPPPDAAAQATGSGTEADKLRAQYKAIGDAQNHKFGEGAPGTKPPDFNLKLPGPATTGLAPSGPVLPAPPVQTAPNPGGARPPTTAAGGSAPAAKPGVGARLANQAGGPGAAPAGAPAAPPKPKPSPPVSPL